MCLYPRLVINRKYLRNKKNGYNAPELKDERIKYVPVPCGWCMECRKKIATEWQIRLQNELSINNKAVFVTLTFNDENLKKFEKELKITECNAIATIAIRRFLERIRKLTQKSVKHWLITELGQDNSERIHIHGIIWTDNPQIIKDKWSYGWVYLGYSMSNKCINYVTKYLTKVDMKHKGFRGKIHSSAKIGINGLKNVNKSKDYYRMSNGVIKGTPSYYRKKIYTDEEREQLWLKRLDEQVRYVRGIKIDVSQTDKEYHQIVMKAREVNKKLGFGDDSDEYRRCSYSTRLSDLQRLTRVKKHEKEVQRRGGYDVHYEWKDGDPE